MAIEKKRTICGVCPGGCAVEVTLDNGVITGVEADKNHPFGAICVRGKAAPEVVYSPDRLKKPLIRIGERGEGKFREAEWDEALETIVRNLEAVKAQYGARAVAGFSGRGAFEQSLSELGGTHTDGASSKFAWALGSPNAASVSSVCFVSFGLLAPLPTFGVGGPALAPDLANSEALVLWGSNPATDSPPFLHHSIIKAQKNGLKVIVIDHMESDAALRADEWIPIRSGTDGALALGLIHVIINENLHDQDFVEQWTLGFDQLAEYVQKFSPEVVEKITLVPQDKIVDLAREIAMTKHVSLRTYTGLEYSNAGVQSIRAVYLIWALTGNLDVQGGLYITPPTKVPIRRGGIKPELDGPPIGAEKYPLFYKYTQCAQFMEFPKAVLEGDPYPIKALLIDGATPLVNMPQPSIYAEAYKKLDFIAVIDRFMTKDALYADVVLPATTYFENVSYQRYPGYVSIRQRAVEPVGEARNDLLIFAELANRLGFGELYPHTDEEILEWGFAGMPEVLEQLKQNPEGVKLPAPERQYRKYELGMLRKDGLPGFETPSGKVEITSTILAELGYDALPKYVEPVESPLGDQSLYESFPLVLNTGARIHSTFRSQHLNIPRLLKIQDRPYALIHPQDGEARGISDDEPITVRTRRGQVPVYARLTTRVLPGMVELNVGGGSPIQAEHWREADVNQITDLYNRDPLSGFPVYKALLCQIEKRK